MLTDKGRREIREGTVMDVYMQGLYTGTVVQIQEAGLVAVDGLGKARREKSKVIVQFAVELFADEASRVVHSAYVLGHHERKPEVKPS